MENDGKSNFKSGITRLIKYIGNYKKGIILVNLLLVIATIISVIGPKILGMATTELGNNVMQKYIYNEICKDENIDLNLYDTIGDLEENNLLDDNIKDKLNDDLRNISLKEAPKINFKYIYKIFIIVAVIYVVSTIFSYIANKTMGLIAAKITYKLRKDLDEKLGRLPLSFYDKNTRGEILSKMTTDVTNIQDTLEQGLIMFIQSAITIIGIVVMMFSINLSMTLITLISLPLSLFIMKNVIKNTQKYFKKSQETIGKLNGHIEEIYSGNIVVKAFNNEKNEEIKFKNINNNLSKLEFKSQFLSGLMMPCVAFVNHLSYIALSVLGVNLVIKGRMSIGNVQAFLQYTNRIMQPISQIANAFTLLQSMVASSDRVFNLLDEKEVNKDPINKVKLTKVLGKVELKNVYFSYDGKTDIIKNFSIKANKGETIAIVGPTGSGKTTIVNLLMKFYDINKGDILIDDVSIKDLTYFDVRNVFSMVLQDTWLFNGTIMDNLKYSRNNIKNKDVIEAAKTVGVDHFINALPGGYNFIINEEANNISDGQKQLLTIVRAMLANSPILILDEATSNVDTRTEEVIQKAMNKLMEGKTSFVIAHRLSTIKNADKIIVMQNGKIVEIGKHDELLNKDGFYAKLYNSQFENS